MSKYYFHILNGGFEVDDVGVELPDLAAVRREAIRASGEMLRRGDQNWKGEAWRMIVVDDAGQLIFSTNFSVDNHGL